MLAEGCENVPVQDWRPVWALRYSVLVKCRGVIKNKGYVVKNCFLLAVVAYVFELPVQKLP